MPSDSSPSDSSTWDMLNKPGWQDRLRLREHEWSQRDRRLSRDDIRDAVGRLSREPFQDLMSVFLQSCPTELELYEFAMAHPDKWVSSIAAISKIAGYTEKTEIDVAHTINVGSISDADLLQRLQDLRNRLASEAMSPGQILTVEDASQSQHADNKKEGHDGPSS